MTLGNIYECPFCYGIQGKNLKRKYRGKYKQYPKADIDVPLVCGYHKRLNDRIQENVKSVFREVITTAKSQIKSSDYRIK